MKNLNKSSNREFASILGIFLSISLLFAVATPVRATDAPSWSVTSHSGKTINSAALGKVTVLNFWATYCLPCMVEMPTLQSLSQKYAKNGLTVVGVSVDAQSPVMLKAFASKFGTTYAMALANPQIMSGFRVGDNVPLTVILDQQGRVISKHSGYVKRDDLERDIRSALKL